MVKQVVKDEVFLSQKSVPATKEDAHIMQDLKDTLVKNKNDCVGMAANMIGSSKKIIVVSLGFGLLGMYNPVITKRQKPYLANEGCLSLTGIRQAKRFEKIEVSYEDEQFVKQTQKFEGYIAQIIQHEVDHLDGIII